MGAKDSEKRTIPLGNSPSDIPPVTCSGLELEVWFVWLVLGLVRLMVWVRGKCPGGKCAGEMPDTQKSRCTVCFTV